MSSEISAHQALVLAIFNDININEFFCARCDEMCLYTADGVGGAPCPRGVSKLQARCNECGGKTMVHVLYQRTREHPQCGKRLQFLLDTKLQEMKDSLERLPILPRDGRTGEKRKAIVNDKSDGARKLPGQSLLTSFLTTNPNTVVDEDVVEDVDEDDARKSTRVEDDLTPREKELFQQNKELMERLKAMELQLTQLTALLCQQQQQLQREVFRSVGFEKEKG